MSSISLNKSRILGALSLVALALVANKTCSCIQLNVDIDHDLTQPTYGLEGKTSSAVHYDGQNGLNLKGTINDLLGPPIKMATGVHNIFKGHNLAGLGAGMKTGGAMLGFDAAVLEAAGAGNLLKGGLLMNGANVKSNLAGQVAGTKGQKVANIIEMPVRVVAMKDLATGSVLNGIGQLKQTGAEAATTKGQQLLSQGQNMKTQGLNQIFQGAQEGVKNINNMVQKTTDNVNTAFKLLPIVWSMNQQQNQEEAAKGQVQQQQQQQQQVEQVQQVQQLQQASQKHPVSTPYQMSPPSGNPLTGGSLFGGLTSLFPGMGTNVFTDAAGSNSGSLFGGNSAPNSAYAALLNSTSPLTNLLMSPQANPFLYPLAQGPFGQAMSGLQPIGTHESQHGGNVGSSTKGGQSQGTEVYDFKFPGLRYHETYSSQLPTFGFGQQSGKTSSSGGVKTQQAVKGQHQESIKGQQEVQQVQQQQIQQVQQVQQPVKQQVQQQTKTKN